MDLTGLPAACRETDLVTFNQRFDNALYDLESAIDPQLSAVGSVAIPAPDQTSATTDHLQDQAVGGRASVFGQVLALCSTMTLPQSQSSLPLTKRPGGPTASSSHHGR